MAEKLLNISLWQSIELLAKNSDIQRKYLKDIGSFPSVDELALEFDDALVPFTNQNNNLDPIIIDKIYNLNLMLHQLNDLYDERIWDESALDTEPWINIRNEAISLLILINN